MILYAILMIYGGLSVVTLAVLLYVVARHGNLTRKDELEHADDNTGKVADGSGPSTRIGFVRRLDGQRRQQRESAVRTTEARGLGSKGVSPSE
jgi:hypothetical protein